MTISEKIMSLSGKRNKKYYLREVQEEIKKVSWTTKEELILSTKIVLGATFLCSMGVYATDLTVRSCMNAVWYFAHLIGA